MVADIEQNTVAADAVGNGLLKLLKNPEILRFVLPLADVLPHLAAFSLLFQKENVYLGKVSLSFAMTLNRLQKLKTENGPHLNQFSSRVNEEEATSVVDKIDSGFKLAFLTKMSEHITKRFQHGMQISSTA